jgi:subtilisin family serine protease
MMVFVPSARAAAPQTDLIIQVEGSTDSLVAHIRDHGGTVRYRYRNVSAVAASVPSDEVAALRSLAGVTAVEKDRLVELPKPERNGRPTTYEAQASETLGMLPVVARQIDVAALPTGYANFALTGAVDIWEDTAYGDGSVVAVIDTGTTPNTCLAHAVIGAPGFPDGYNATGDGIPATSPSNISHGTQVGGVIAASCGLDFSADPSDPLYQAIATYLPWDPEFVPLLGQAPEAKLYPVKVFRADGDTTPTSVILDGLDHVLTLKRNGDLDVDIVNMSLGGGTLFDGLDTFDRFVLQAWREKIVVVTSAGNGGPTPNTIGSPATAYNTIAVGALDYAISSRVLYEYIGLAFFGTPGQGSIMRPDSMTRVANFSSRGPISDGRAAPDISALGVWNFQATPTDTLGWVSGTSFSSPTVAGGAALLNAYWENQLGRETSPRAIRAALLGGADPTQVGEAWRSVEDQGEGALDLGASLALLEDGRVHHPPFRWVGPLRPNILKHRCHHSNHDHDGDVDTFETGPVEVNGSVMHDYTFEIDESTSRVVVEIYDMVAEDNFDYAFWANALELNIQSAKRSDLDRPVGWLWYPQFWGDSVTYTIDDGLWLEESDYFGTYFIADQPMEPGIMKVTLGADYSNETPVSYKVRITRENLRKPLRHPVRRQRIEQDDSIIVPVDIPDGVQIATFDLTWFWDWSRFPTSDLDMWVYDPEGNLVAYGATVNAPERAEVFEPAAGTWFVEVVGYEVPLQDRFKLYVTTE